MNEQVGCTLRSVKYSHKYIFCKCRLSCKCII